MSRLPLLPDSVSASFLPSGDYDGAPLMPARADTMRFLSGAQVLHVNGRHAPLERDVRQPFAVRRPGRRHDGQRRLQMRTRLAPSASATIQLIRLRRRLAVDRHVGDARGERAAHADDLFVERIGDAMRAIAQVRGLDGHVRPEHALAGEHVDELRVDAHVAVRTAPTGGRPRHSRRAAVSTRRHRLRPPSSGVNTMSVRAMPLKRPLLSRSRWMTCGNVDPPSAGTARANGTMAIGDGIGDAGRDGETQLRERGSGRGAASASRRQSANFFMRSFMSWVRMLAPNCARTAHRQAEWAEAKRDKPRLRPIRAARHRRCCNYSLGRQ